MIRLTGGTQWPPRMSKAVRLLFVMRGDGTCNRKPYGKHALIEIADGEVATFFAAAETEMVSLTMPRVKAAPAM